MFLIEEIFRYILLRTVLTIAFFGRMLRKAGTTELFTTRAVTAAAAARLFAAFELSLCIDNCNFGCCNDCDCTLISGLGTFLAVAVVVVALRD